MLRDNFILVMDAAGFSEISINFYQIHGVWFVALLYIIHSCGGKQF
jgi:hypothetical protein